MLIAVYAGYMVDTAQIREWSKLQTDPELSKCFSEARYVSHVGLRNYLELKKMSNHIGVHSMPYPKGDAGGTHLDRWYIVLYRRHGEYRMPLRQFSDWEKYQEQEDDLKYKEFLKTLCVREPGLELKEWTIAAWVGHVGVFYDFSEEVVAGIYKRAEAAREKRLNSTESSVSATT